MADLNNIGGYATSPGIEGAKLYALGLAPTTGLTQSGAQSFDNYVKNGTGIAQDPTRTGIYNQPGLEGYNQPTTDPYAKYGGQAAFDSLRSGFDAQKQGIHSTSNEAAANAGLSLRGSITDYVNSIRSGQRQIDESGVQNELSRQQGTQGIMNMVGRGIRSGATMLNNKNAGTSSGGEAIANAYGQIGRSQLSNVGNQYELGNRQIGMQQTGFDEQAAAGAQKIGDSKTQVVNNIVMDARSKFAELDAAMQNASMPDRIAIDQEKESLRSQVMASLQQYDSQLQQGRSGIQATSGDARRTEANRLAGLGQAPTNAFEYGTDAPNQFNGTGPYSADLPLFTMPRGRRTA